MQRAGLGNATRLSLGLFFEEADGISHNEKEMMQLYRLGCFV